MANVVSDGEQVQILTTDGHSFQLDQHALGRILLQDHVKDKPVVVLAVVGACRKGKSFLLNFLLRYLRNRGRVDWLGEDNAPLEGFKWRGGSERDTTGILMWKEVFLVPTSEGQELAVLLMDTQGIFDCKAAAKVHRAIFALSTLVSSVLVYNVSQNIQEDHLEHLQLFTEYSRLAQQEMNGEPFQKVVFLVRDWECPYEASYGAEGGQVILERRLETTDDQDAGLRQLRERLRSCFAKIACFLMPHPGKKAATSPAFEGRISEIDEEFIEELARLTPLLLAPDSLLVKKINGREITCQELVAYFEAYVHFIKKCPELGPQSAYEATIQASNLAAMYVARDLYIAKLLKIWKALDRVDRGIMEGHHYRLLEEAKDLYENTPKLGGPEYSRHYMGKLTREIEGIFQNYSDFFKENKIRFVDIVDTVAFKAAHAVITTGVAGAAIGLAVVELPIIAAVCCAVGAVSLTGHIYHAFDTSRRKRKKKAEEASARPRATTAESACDNALEQVFSEDQPTHTADIPQNADKSRATPSAEHFSTSHELETEALLENFTNERLSK